MVTIPRTDPSRRLLLRSSVGGVRVAWWLGVAREGEVGELVLKHDAHGHQLPFEVRYRDRALLQSITYLLHFYCEILP